MARASEKRVEVCCFRTTKEGKSRAGGMDPENQLVLASVTSFLVALLTSALRRMAIVFRPSVILIVGVGIDKAPTSD